MAGHALMTANPNVIARPSTEDEVRELIRASGTVENVSELARRLGWTRSKLIRFLDQEEGEGRITRSIGSTGRALIAVSAPVRTPVRTPGQPTERRITRSISSTGRALIAVSAPVRTPEQPTEHITPERRPDGVAARSRGAFGK